jgi:Autoinducer binding domain
MVETIVDETTMANVLNAGRGAMVRLGMTLVSFHVTVPHKSQVGRNSFVAEIGVPAKWMESYVDAEFRVTDPIPDLIVRHGESVPVRDVVSQLGKLTEALQAYIDELIAMVPIHAWGIPTFGTFDFDSCCAVSLGREMTLKDDSPLI